MKYMILIALLMISVISGKTYPTGADPTECTKCYANNNIHCLKEDLSYSECGEFAKDSDEEKAFIAKYKYCTKNVKEDYYK